MDLRAERDDGLVRLVRAKVHLLQKAAADAQEGLSRPAAVPIDGAAVDERRELAAARAEGLADGRHAQHDVQVVTHAVDEGRPAHIARGRQAEAFDVGADITDDALLLIGLVHSGHFARIEQVVQILKKALVDHLRVGEAEAHLLALHSSRGEEVLEVLAELAGAVTTRELDLKELVVRHEAGEARERLLARAADAHHHCVAAAGAARGRRARCITASMKKTRFMGLFEDRLCSSR